MTLAYFASRSRLDPEASLAADAAGRDWSCSWGTPGPPSPLPTSEVLVSLQQQRLTQKHPCCVITVMHDHRVPKVKPFMYAPCYPSMERIGHICD